MPPKYWNPDNSFFSGMSEEMAELILHFVYGQCLPETMTMKSAVECIGLVDQIPELANLVTACRTFLRNKPLMNSELDPCLPLAITRWVQSTFSSLCPLSSNQRC